MSYSNPVTIDTLKSRIDSELQLIGAFTNDTKTSLISDAVRKFCRKYEPDNLSATLAVTADVLEYSIPDAIDKISRLFDENFDRLVYKLDSRRRKITLLVAPSGAVNYVVYGTPNEIRTNLAAVISALDEDHEDCVWMYIAALCAKQARDPGWVTEYQAAEAETVKLRQYRNRNTDMADQAILFRDRVGKVLDDPANQDGQPVDYPDVGEISDL